MKKSQEFQEKQVSINGLEINYKIAGPAFVKTSAGKSAIVILHGWGSSSNSWKNVQAFVVKAGITVIVPDLPGFGRTPPPKTVWGVHEYEDFVFRFLDALKIKKCVLLGHSFGGQVSIQFAILHPELIDKLILVAPAAVRHKPGWQTYVLKYAAKAVGAVLYVTPSNVGTNLRRGAYALLGRRDYSHANGVMKDIFKKVIHEDLSGIVQNITVPTLLLWGERDQMTSIEDGKFVAQKIPGVTFITFSKHGHNLHAEIPEETSKAIVEFLKK